MRTVFRKELKIALSVANGRKVGEVGMNDSEYLKPCPFCGESGEEIQDRSFYLPNIYIGIFYCLNCGGAMIDTNKNHCWYDRVKLWNKRFCADGEAE